MWQLLEENIPGFGEVSKAGWIAFITFAAVFEILNIIAFWRVFEKAGEKGWKSLIPIYNVYIMFKVAWSPKAFLNFVLITIAAVFDEWMMPTADDTVKVILTIATVFASIYTCVVLIIMNIRLAKAFGHGVWFGLGLYFFEVPFILILGLGRSKYTRLAPDPNFEEPHVLTNR